MPKVTNSLENKITKYIIQNKNKHYRIAYSYVKNTEDALDIVQESIYKAFASINSLKKCSSMNSWFCRIVVNTLLDFLRKQKKLVFSDNEDFISQDTEEMNINPNIDLHNALDNLPDKYRKVIVLRFFEDLKIREIAEILSENTNTIKTRLYKSLELLHHYLL